MARITSKKGETVGSKVGVRGFFRVQLNDSGRIVGDSGWQENQVVNDGIQQYLVNWLLGDTGNGKSVTHMTLGTGTQPASNGTSLAGEINDMLNDDRPPKLKAGWVTDLNKEASRIIDKYPDPVLPFVNKKPSK